MLVEEIVRDVFLASASVGLGVIPRLRLVLQLVRLRLLRGGGVTKTTGHKTVCSDETTQTTTLLFSCHAYGEDLGIF